MSSGSQRSTAAELPSSRTYSSRRARLAVSSPAAWLWDTAAPGAGTSPRKVPAAVSREKAVTTLSDARTVTE